MKRNTLATLIGAVIFGLFAVWLARGWIDEAVESEFAETRPVEQVDPVKSFGDPVVVALVDVPFGTEITAEMLKIVDVPEEARPQGAFSDLDQLFTDTSRPTVALASISANEMILAERVTGPGGKRSLSALIEPGMRAASIRVSTVSGVGGFVLPGDRVDIFYVRDEETRRNGVNLKSDLLLQNVKVLGIDQNHNPDTDQPAPADTFTLEVTPGEAQRLQLAQDTGTLTLSLRPMGDTEDIQAPTVFANALTGQTVSRSPPRPATKSKVASPKSPVGSEIVVVRGETREPVVVFNDDRKDQQLAQMIEGGR